MSRVVRRRDQEELLRIVKLKELRIILNRTPIGQSVPSIRPQPPLPLLHEAESLPPPASALLTVQATTVAAQNVGIVQEGTHPCGNADSRIPENFPVLSPPPTNRGEEPPVLNQSQLPYWINKECAAGSCISRNIQIDELIGSVQRMNKYMRGLQDKVKRLEDEKNQFQIQLSSSNSKNEKLKNDASKMEKELQQREQPESLFLKVQESVDNLKNEFQQLNLKVEDAIEKMSGAIKNYQGFKDLGNKMEEIWRKLEQIEEKMEKRGERGKPNRLVFEGVVTIESEEESSNEYQQSCNY